MTASLGWGYVVDYTRGGVHHGGTEALRRYKIYIFSVPRIYWPSPRNANPLPPGPFPPLVDIIEDSDLLRIKIEERWK
jgi:hypothetical protein